MTPAGEMPPEATRAQLKLLSRLHLGKERRQAGLCLVEGAVLLAEALRGGIAPQLVAVEQELLAEPAVEEARAAGAEVVLVDASRAARVSDRQNARGLLAAVPHPPAWDERLRPEGPALVVVLCGLQDPGNVGTLLRSGAAFGTDAIMATEGTADVFGPKVIRASAGACFSLAVASVERSALADFSERHGLSPVAAMPASSEAAHGVPPEVLPERCLLLLGHETRGVPDVGGARRVCVAHASGVDSLNVAVAGSILMSAWYSSRARAGA